MVALPSVRTALVGGLGVAILFVPIPVLTQLVGIPLLVYACYRHWGWD